MNTNQTIISTLAAVLVLLAGCRTEERRPSGEITGEKVTVTLRPGMSAPIHTVPDTRTAIPENSGNAFTVRLTGEEASSATRAVQASFYNLWAFQFGADGTIVGNPQQLSGSDNPVTEGGNLSVSLTVGQAQTIYLVSGGKKMSPNLAGIKTLQELQEFKLDYITSEKGGYTSTVADDEDIPYAGSISGVNVISLGQGAGMLEYNSPEGFAGSIGMEALVAKVTLRYKYEAETHLLQGVRLQNVNAHVTPGNRATYTPEGGVEFRLFNLQLGAPDAQGYYTASWYVAPNLQGEHPGVTSEQERYYKQGSNLAPQYGLCLEVLGKNKERPTEYSVHLIFVGKNNTTNFDVEANHHYRLTTEFTTAYTDGNTDPRIDVSEFTGARIDFFTSALLTTGGLCTSASGEKYDLDAHYDYRPIVVEAAGCTVDLGIYSDAACTQLVRTGDPAQNWLQLSVEPNYTLAVNNRTSPLTNHLSVAASVPTRLNFYLYNDEYADVAPDNTSPKRSLYLKISTTELNAASPKVTVDCFRIDQCPMLVCGRYGGQWNASDGTYDQLLGADLIKEYSVSYTNPETPTSYTIQMGYNQSGSEYIQATDQYDGLAATIRLSENPLNVKVRPVGDKNYFTDMPANIGGKIDLYHYTYYHNFAARYCYDRNRDLDGSGALENPNSRGENEIKWYLPGLIRAQGIFLNGESGKYPTDTWTIGSSLNSPFFYSWGAAYAINPITEPHHCVRNMPVPAGASTVSRGPKVAVEQVPNTDGSGGSCVYAIVDATDMPQNRIADRMTQSDFYVDVPLYTEDGVAINDATTGKQKTVKRIVNHLQNNSGINQAISRKFAVAPEDCDHTNNWAYANGWHSNANTIVDSNMAVETGCPAYRGREGKDKPGTWRTPTLRESFAISLLRAPLQSTQNSGTGFTLTNTYWTATMYNAEYARSAILSSTYSHYSPKTSGHNARCVRDLP